MCSEPNAYFPATALTSCPHHQHYVIASIRVPVFFMRVDLTHCVLADKKAQED